MSGTWHREWLTPDRNHHNHQAHFNHPALLAISQKDTFWMNPWLTEIPASIVSQEGMSLMINPPFMQQFRAVKTALLILIDE